MTARATSVSTYSIQGARAEHLTLLPAIERAAAAQFPDDVITPEVRAGVVPREEMEAALADRRLWVATDVNGDAVGFAIAMQLAGAAFLREIDVHPDHQRQGLGRRLIQEVERWAKDRALGSISLTTFEHVPWNAPFYARLGFRKLADDELDRELRDLLHLERAQGLRQRVAMRRML